tara:strand:+ start:2228 stop:3298 length:1071 start_codon:yes stop_codon:yes gene_type:complete
MHILFLADASSPHSYRWIKYFSKIKGVRVTWCSFSENTMPKLDNVEVKILDKSNPIKFIKSLQFISKKSADIIHVHYLGWNGLLALFFPKTPTILTAWGSDIVFNSKNWVMRFFIKRMIRQSKLITCDAYHLRDRLIELGSEKEKVKIIMFGIDETLFISERKPFELTLPANKFIIGSIRNLHPVYDVITFLKAAKEVLNQRNDVIFNVAGSGPDLESLKEFVDNNGMQEDVKFLGRLDSSQLFSFYDNLDIYISTALSDGGIASSTAEAMLCKRPVIITDVAENSLWVKDHENGRLFDCSDSLGLAKIIFELLESKEKAINMGLKANNTAIERNSYDNEMAKMLEIYKSSLEVVN